MPDGVLQRLGDAVAGVDRQGAAIQGMQDRALLDQRRAGIESSRAQTEAAFALAHQRRVQAEREQAEFEAAQAAHDALLADPNAVPMGDLVLGNLGTSYSGATQGRLRTQEHGFRSTIADPTGGQADPALGEQVRRAAAQAVYPNALARGEVDANAPLEIVMTDEGPRFVQRPEAVGMAPGARPSAASTGALGGLEAADSNSIYRQAAALFGGTYDPATQSFTALDPETAVRAQAVAELGAELFVGGGATHPRAVGEAFRRLRERNDWDLDPLQGTLGDEVGGAAGAPGAGAPPAADPAAQIQGAVPLDQVPPEAEIMVNDAGVWIVFLNGAWREVQR